MKTTLRDSPAFVQWAKSATAGLDHSGVMVGILDRRGPKAARWEFAIQIGHCLLEDKPLVLLTAMGDVIPEKLRAAATIIEEYRPGDLVSMKAATEGAPALMPDDPRDWKTETRIVDCPECHEVCGWCAWYRKNAREVGCGAGVSPMPRTHRRCEWGESAKGQPCKTCDGSGRVRATITYAPLEAR